jgi:uncharacterized protein YoxC
MPDPKPLSFDKVVLPPAKPVGSPKPLSFPPVVNSQPTGKFEAKAVSFENVTVPVKVKPVQYVPKSIDTVATSPIHGDALARFRTAYPDLFRQEELSITRQIQQLLPLKVEVILDWGTKTMERARDSSTDATAFVTMFVQAGGNDLLKQAIDGINGVHPTGLVDRFFSKSFDPITTEPRLLVLHSHLSPWLKQCDELIKTTKDRANDVAIKLATLSAVADSIDQITDNTLDQAVSNRRMILQQGSMQAELSVRSLEDIRRQIIDQKMRIDQVLNVTLPAYKAAHARR